MKIVVSYDLPRKGFESLAKAGHELIFPERVLFSETDLLSVLADADVLVSVFVLPVNKKLMDAGKNLKMIANYGVGFNNIDVEYASLKGIVVTNTPDPVVEPTAELALGLMFAVARRIPELDRKIREKDGLKWGIMENLSASIFGKTLGIVGMGNIGKALAKRAHACGMKIVYTKRSRLALEIEKKYHAEYKGLDDLLRESDFVSINAPYSKSTHHIIDEDALRKMKRSAFLINTARGPLVDEAALANALEDGIIAGAGLDVFENEPEIHPVLLRLNNVVMLPHVGTGTAEARIEIGKCVSKNVLAYLNGETNFDIVNPEVNTDFRKNYN